ncbi:conserved exported hypothetical protein [Bosea sp. 62]|uniref:hypothetical protein n=1 Tax=unclassified Bosea (in: a-proteobacteria) TaxID=2653178 RepID=UPI00125C6AEE|nr:MULTISPECIES: hypothetical protein [unclassified Bosea (in: a-proteobacteria)]CAD5293531.1 conserved exported hypothetical protein [Bosea sp. 7B]CAD5298438.1 conserved exported hypothetical protein [Bosea sp. 21B]CAD5298608.1 conserved exported hypothetical protein [Bosea sp. 46]VVT61469.1 conserved exported hypothetical protein [Bosea sp. EC-HK365B]VXB13733.1 conserved exported hypothetical protein [Bosea sp. 127]
MLRKLVLGLSAAAALGVAGLGMGAVTATPAEAQALGGGYGPHVWGGGGYYGRPRYGYGGPRYGYGGPRYGYGGGYYGPRCYVRPVRYWDGWGWVVRERRICR